MNHALAKTQQAGLVRDNFGMYIFFGALLIIVGAIVAGSFIFVALASTFLFGLLLLIVGVVFFLQAFVNGKWSVFFLHVFGGLLLLGSGFFIMANPSVSLATFTLLLSLVFLAIGLTKMTASATEKDTGWEYDFVGGIVIFILGILIWRLPVSTNIGLLGLFFGLGIIATGISEFISGMQLHQESKSNLAV